MKKLFFGLITTATLFLACNKTDLQQASDSIKNADSLFNEAKQSYKTLDSISKVVNDSNSTIGKVIAPELNKHKEIIEDAIKNGNLSIDSLNKEFEKINHNSKQAEEIKKTIDSVNNAIKSGDNAAAVIAETASKILKQTTKNKTKPQSEPEVQNENQSSQPLPLPQSQPEKYPITKTTRLQIEVNDIAEARAILNQNLSNYNGDLITENHIENEGVVKDFLTIKVPLNNFDELVNNTTSLGNVESKNTEVEGKDYIGSQMCDVEITLVDKTPEQSTTNEDLNVLNKDEKPQTFGEKSTEAFSKGFTILGSLFLALIPFWPIFLIGGIIWYFAAKRNKKKREEEFQRQLALEREKMKNAETSVQPIPQEEVKNSEDEPKTSTENTDDDITKYMPKS